MHAYVHGIWNVQKLSCSWNYNEIILLKYQTVEQVFNVIYLSILCVIYVSTNRYQCRLYAIRIHFMFWSGIKFHLTNSMHTHALLFLNEESKCVQTLKNPVRMGQQRNEIWHIMQFLPHFAKKNHVEWGTGKMAPTCRLRGIDENGINVTSCFIVQHSIDKYIREREMNPDQVKSNKAAIHILS